MGHARVRGKSTYPLGRLKYDPGAQDQISGINSGRPQGGRRKKPAKIGRSPCERSGKKRVKSEGDEEQRPTGEAKLREENTELVSQRPALHQQTKENKSIGRTQEARKKGASKKYYDWPRGRWGAS